MASTINTSKKPSTKKKKLTPEEELAQGINWGQEKAEYQKMNLPILGEGQTMPENKTVKPQAKANPPKGTVETFTNSQGNASGVTLPDGRTFLGLSPQDVSDIAKGEAERTARPENSAPVGTAQNQANRQVRLNELVKMGEQGLLSPSELQAIKEAPIDWGQALTAGTVGNLPSVLTNVGVGVGTGAAAGSVVPGVGTILGGATGGVLGLIKSIWGGTQSNIKKQQSGNIAATKDVLTAARTNMRALVMVASKDPSKAEEAITLYYAQLAQVHRAQRKLQLEVQGNLNAYMEDGTQDLSDFELFLQPGGYAEIQLMRLQQSMLSGQPASDAELLQLSEEMNGETETSE